MVRSQILLTEELDKRIKFLAEKQNVSQSEVVRTFLEQSILSGKTNQNDSSKPKVDKFYYELPEFNKKNPRILGFKEIFSIGGKTVDIKVVDSNVFKFYIKNNCFPEGFSKTIYELADKIKENSVTKKIVVRRAYVVPGLDNPPGPRFLGLTPVDVEDAIKQLFDFAIEQGYHKVKGSDICAFIYPFADPEPLSVPVKASNLPYGGYAVPLNKEVSKVEVLAVWGNNEGVQSFDSIDRYVVNTNRMIIESKNIPQKDVMLATTTKSQSEKISVPVNKQFDQVLNDAEIIEVARVVKDLSKKYSLRRIEFSYDGISSIIFNESIPYQISEKDYTDFSHTGKVIVISSEKEVERLKEMDAEEISNTVVYVAKCIVENRQYDVLNSVATLKNKFVVLYPGLSATAHAMRVLTDFGHKALVVGNKVYSEGEQVSICVKNMQVVIRSGEKTRISKYYANLYDARLEDVAAIGGKAQNLSTLKSRGFNTPHGIVLTTNFFDKAVKTVGQLEGWRVDELLVKKILDEAKLDKKKKYAVRSSANFEDQAEHSFAGQFLTDLNVDYVDIPQSVERVIKSTANKHVARYINAVGKKLSDLKMAVVIQEMVDAQKAGVTFGRDIQTDNEDLIVIDVKKGLAEGIVDGTSRADRLVYSRSHEKIITGQTKLLSKDELEALIEMTYSIEDLMGGVQDIEWAFAKDGSLWLVQTRDI